MGTGQVNNCSCSEVGQERQDMPLTLCKFSSQTTTNIFAMYSYMYKRKAKMHEVEHSYHIAEAIFIMLRLHQHAVKLFPSPFYRACRRKYLPQLRLSPQGIKNSANATRSSKHQHHPSRQHSTSGDTHARHSTSKCGFGLTYLRKTEVK